MTTRRGAPDRVLRRILVLAVALCALYATVGSPVSAAPHPLTAEALPATGLGDQVIAVAWQGFAPTRSDGTDGVVIMQCRAHPRSVNNDCNTANTFPYDLNGNQQAGTTAKDGTGSVFIDIMTTARLPSLACSQATPCSLLVYETTPNGYDANGLPPANTRVIVPLSFARNSADCPPVQSYDFKVEAEASAAPALYQWAAALCTGQHAFAIDITNTSSNQARQDFLTNLVDMGVTSTPPEAGEITPAAPKYSVVPLDLTGIVIAYNITDPVTHKQITDLTLTPRLVARLLSDTNIEAFFSDPEFQQLNPHLHWPIQAADPGLRGEKNADTWLVTNWVNANANARAFLDGKDKYGVPVNPSWLHVTYPTDVFAARNSNGVYFPRIGEEGVAQRLFASTKPADSVPTAPLDAGEIGILDYPTAVRFKLPVANLTDGVGQPVVPANPFSIAAGYATMQNVAGFHVEPAPASGANVYPLAKVDQAMVPPKLTTSPKDLRMRAFLDYAVGPGQMNMPPGYVPLPTALALQTLHYTTDLPVPTTTTTPTTTSFAIPSSPLTNYVPPTAGGGYPGSSPTTIPGTSAPTTGGPNGTTSPAPTTPAPNGARFVALRLSSSGDHLVFPIILGMGLLAV
ncbi:MAG TPA: substrate-binding domain-containing protein, partial [Acidimicrobiia bacterium]|nr:substrate-binding domain-containing protein [Acidimicrobiia bacterium]